AIVGTKKVCEGYTVTLSNTSTPGSWTSSSGTIASVISGSGVVTGNIAGTTMITYTLGTGCIATTVVTVNPSPAPILGVMAVCKGLVSPLSDAIFGGTWSSSNPALATVSGTGVVTGMSAGAPVITYKLPAGCFETTVVTVNPLPNVITGTMKVCEGLTTTLKDFTLLGTWTSGNPSMASVVSNTGVVTGVATGTADITYVLSTGCQATTVVTVNPTPANITGASSVCSSSSISLFDVTAPGTWGSTSISLVAVNPVTGSVKGLNPGVANITYTLPEGCMAFKTVTVNPLPVMHSVTGGGSYCAGDTGVHISLAGSDTGINYQIYWGTAPIFKVAGTGNMIDLGLFTTGGTYSAIAVNKYTTCSVPMPGSAPVTIIPALSPITGPATVCVAANITLGHPLSGGTWVSSDMAAATIDNTTGLVKGIATGTTIITYRIPAGCMTTTPLVVNPFPDTIVGNPTVCAGLTTTLSDDGTGTWTSSRSAIATIDPVTGVMKGVFRGNCIITYTLPTGCFVFKTATVNPLPDAITGDNMVCVGATAYLSDAYAGGTWKSGNPTIATITTTGTLGTATGVAQGTAAVTYTLPTGCMTAGVMTVNTLPTVGAISGPLEVCQGKTIVLSDPTAGGIWTSKTGLTSVAELGHVTGAVPGKDTVLYSVTNMCGTVSAKWVVTVTQCDFTQVPNIVNGNAELKVFPNPNEGVFSVNLLSDINEPVNIVITNMVGQKVKEVSSVTNSAVTMQLDIAAGVYLLTGYTAHGTYVAKVTIAR
ncbi:MAG: hypothetical protein JWQ38_482, partial [Flavipsychrobacter sp.]|nr:hypothetical protein [Flavipsychrobacter sp.]